MLFFISCLFSISVLAQEKSRYAQLLKLKVYPIPADKALYVEMDSIDLCEVRLYNSLGKRLITAIPDSSLNKLEIQTTHLNNGFYILQITKAGEMICRKRIFVRR